VSLQLPKRVGIVGQRLLALAPGLIHAALHEIYVRAEGDLNGADLEAALREYRKRKTDIERKS
jgi:hypothetical protein